jgi:hypothetical protein
MDDQCSRRAIGIRIDVDARHLWRRSVAAGQRGSDGGGKLRIYRNAIRLRARETLEGDAGNGGQRFFIDGQLAVEHSPGDQEGEFYDIPFGTPAQIGPHSENLGYGSVEALQNGLELGADLLLALTFSGLKSFAALRGRPQLKLVQFFPESGAVVISPVPPVRRAVARFEIRSRFVSRQIGEHQRLGPRRMAEAEYFRQHTVRSMDSS